MAESPKAYKREDNRQDRRSMDHEMQVVKRNGTRETISFDKITKRIRSLAKDLQVDPLKISQKVIENLYDGVSTFELDELTAQQAASMCLEHPDHSMLAGKVASSNHQKNTSNSFFKTVKMLYEATDINDNHSPIVSKELFDVVKKHKKEIEDAIDYERDFLYDYFGFQTLKRSYLLKVKGEPVERVQHMIMRVSLGIHCVQGSVDLASALETYDLMSRKMFTHATPTLFNSGTPKPQLSSCFLMGMEDSVEGIFKTLTDCAKVSRSAGGLGIWVSDIRCRGSYIAGTNGVSNGLVPLLRTYNTTARFIDQCLRPKTSFVVAKKGLQSVETLQPNDEILSKTGIYVKIKRVLERKYAGNMQKITTATGSIECTPEHQIWTARKYKSSDTAGQHPTPKYRSASEIVIGDFMLMPKPKFEQDVDSLGMDDCEFVGIIIEYGKFDGNGGELTNMTEEALQFSKEYLKIHGIRFETESRTLRWMLEDTSPSLPFTRSMLMTSGGSSRLSSCFRHLPGVKIRRLLKWIRNASCETVSYIRARCSDDEKQYQPIISIESNWYNGLVYDIHTTEETSFVTQIGIVHSA